MSTAGYKMHWGSGYRSKKEPDETAGPEPEVHQEDPADAGHDGHEEIHEHLASMHAATGHAHSHVEHHGDGKHTSYHVDDAGQVSGPHEHGSLEELHSHMSSLHGEGEMADQGMDEREAM
jgi:hypothetical protein